MIFHYQKHTVLNYYALPCKARDLAVLLETVESMPYRLYETVSDQRLAAAECADTIAFAQIT
jgi:hypothetical protein